MLALLRKNHDNNHIKLTQEFARDLNWFVVFLKTYNGITYYDTRNIHDTIFLGASLTGLGGCFNQIIYTIPFPRGYKGYNINHLEMLNVMVALKIWGPCWENKNISIRCDNLSVVEILNTGKARDPILATCTRNVWLLTAVYNIHLTVQHIQGRSNHIADLLSRWFITQHNQEKFNNLLPHHTWVPAHIDLMMFNQFILFISDHTPSTAQLATRALACLQTAYRPATQRNYTRMHRDFITFLVAAELSPLQVNSSHILMFWNIYMKTPFLHPILKITCQQLKL